MKPSLLMIVLLTGSVHSRTFWGWFNAFFGDKADSETQNMIPDDDENYKERKPVDNRFDDTENNEIILRHPITGQKWSYTDNRTGWIFKTKGDPRTAEGYRQLLQELSEYLGNLSGIERGPNYVDDTAVDLDEGDDDDPFEWYPHHDDDSDYWDEEWDNDVHDELK